jgi:hypothetical protein
MSLGIKNGTDLCKSHRIRDWVWKSRIDFSGSAGARWQLRTSLQSRQQNSQGPNEPLVWK